MAFYASKAPPTQMLQLTSSELAPHRGFASHRVRILNRRKIDLVATMEGVMPEAEIGWIAAIIVGGLAGWLAEMFMKSGTGILMNIILGIVGAALANWLLSLLGVGLGGWIGYLIAGFIGACIIIFLWRAIRGRTA
jgi:uncharacterized membrane protein YeaQ/YmgE (transglycosylase-associated protein family)